MRLRNNKVAKRLGTKALAGVLAIGLIISTPAAALADGGAETAGTQSTASQTPAAQAEKLQAKSVDGKDTLTDVSDAVKEMIQRGEVKLDESTGYLIDTTTGQKTNPVTGERVDQIPAIPATPAEPEQPAEPATPVTPAEPEQPAEPEAPAEPEQPATPETPATPAEPAAPAEPEQPADTVTSAKSNQALVAKQQIIKLPQIVEDFRFWTVARKYAFAKSKINIREAIPENIDGSNTQDVKTDLENAKADTKKLQKKKKKITKKQTKTIKNKIFKKAKSKAVRNLQKTMEERKNLKQKGLDAALANQQLEEKVRTVGTLSQDGLLYILKEEENGWLYVESGNVRGFVKASEVYTGDAAQEILDVYQTKAQKKAEKAGMEYTGIEGTAKTAEATVDAKENQAYTYLRATVNPTVAEKDYALVNDQIETGILNIKEENNPDARTVGTLKQGQLCYILADKDADWVYIESGNVRGFVEKKYLDNSDETKQQITTTGEEQYKTAEETVKPEENAALYYTLASVKEGTPSGEIRESILQFASQFIGNPYVWGGRYKSDRRGRLLRICTADLQTIWI